MFYSINPFGKCFLEILFFPENVFQKSFKKRGKIGFSEIDKVQKEF